MQISVADAARRVGKSKATLLRAIKSGVISADREAVTGAFRVDEAELQRVYPPRPEAAEAKHAAAGEASWSGLRAQLEAADARIQELRDSQRHRDETISDLRSRLDTATGQLGEALSQVRLLTDQRATDSRSASPSTDSSVVADLARPRRRWWRFGR